MKTESLSDLCIKTDRLLITPFIKAHASALCALSCESENRRCLPDEVCETEGDASRAIAVFADNLTRGECPLLYAVTLHNGTLIGHVEIVSLGTAHEIGYHIGHDYTRMGYASEALSAFIPVMMRLLRITYLYGICEAENVASRGVLEHVGFSFLDERNSRFLEKESKIGRYYMTASMVGIDASTFPPQQPLSFFEHPRCAIRPVQSTDSERIRSIYAPYILNTNVSFETVVPSESDFQKRVCGICTDYPYFVFEDDGVISGYAYASRFAQRQAYCYSAELSVYCAADSCHQGIGSALYRVLLPSLAQMGYYTVYAGITVPNPNSVALHRAFGFNEVGSFQKAGYKNDTWIDVLWMQRAIRPYTTPGERAKPIS